MRSFKTPKGTELPIMDIKGKDYLQAAPRIVWFREENPKWGIETEFLSLSDSHAVCRATIRNEEGRIIAQATSMETKQGFESFVEKAETCAVSRAASFCNYGTLMAQELEEQGKLDERENSGSAKLAESPQGPRGNSSLKAVPRNDEPGAATIPFEKSNQFGSRIDSLSEKELESMANFLGKLKPPISPKTAEFKVAFDLYIEWKFGRAK